MGGKSMGFDEARRGGSKVSFLGSLKKAGEQIVCLHVPSGVAIRRTHVIPYVGLDDKTKKPKIMYFNMTCLEDPDDYSIEDPQACPIEMFMSYLINNASIADDELVWEASAGSQKYDKFVTKADFIGQSDNWQNSFKSRQESILVVVDAEKPENGLQFSIESASLWYSLKSMVDKEIVNMGEEIGHPGNTPYAIRFIYDAKALPANKYDTAPYRQFNISDAIHELLDAPAISLRKFTRSRGLKKLRDIMESCIRVDVNMDMLFANVKTSELADDQESDTSFDTKQLDAETKNSTNVKKASPLENTDVVDSHDESNNDRPDNAEECETCGGTGEIKGKRKNVPCPMCEGLGYTLPDTDDDYTSNDAQYNTTDESPFIIKCEQCKGTGKIKGKRKTVDCPACDGTGIVEPGDDDELKECFKCGEIIMEETNPCPFCGAKFKS